MEELEGRVQWVGVRWVGEAGSGEERLSEGGVRPAMRAPRKLAAVFILGLKE